MPWIAEPAERTEPLYPDYLPVSDKGEVTVAPPFVHDDPAFRADPSFPNLLPDGVKHSPVTPRFGTEVEGIQLSALSPAGLDELGLLVAQRGFAVFRKQDFKDAGMQKQLDTVRHFGPLHQHFKAPHAGDHKEFSVMYQSAADVKRVNLWGDRASRINWHHDQSHEKQPPSVTFFFVLENEGWTGGDTIMADSVAAFEALSDHMKDFLLGLRAHHTDNNKSKTMVLREELNTLHPVVIKHPVTGDRALYVNELFTKDVQGLRIEESEYLLRFLFDYQARAQDFQARCKWEEGTVVVWDQRRCQHTATLDTDQYKRRHMIRIMALSGEPIPARD